MRGLLKDNRFNEVGNALLIAFLPGVLAAIFSYDILRSAIQLVMLESGAGKLVFVGKNFYIFNSLPYILFFALVFAIYYLLYKLRQFYTLIISIATVLVSVIILSYLQAWRYIVECTACQNGIRKLQFSEVPYEGIIAISLIISLIPSAYKFIINRKFRLS
jgi:hypothetical protein